jgi:hypothetical protein
MKKTIAYIAAAAGMALLSGCAAAAFNKVQMESVRNVSVGEELIKLQEAHEKGIINDTEYAQAKEKALKLLDNPTELELD